MNYVPFCSVIMFNTHFTDVSSSVAFVPKIEIVPGVGDIAVGQINAHFSDVNLLRMPEHIVALNQTLGTSIVVKPVAPETRDIIAKLKDAFLTENPNYFSWDKKSTMRKATSNMSASVNLGPVTITKQLTGDYNPETDAIRNCSNCGRHYNFHDMDGKCPQIHK